MGGRPEGDLPGIDLQKTGRKRVVLGLFWAKNINQFDGCRDGIEG
jgi:hypothetical protein